MTPGSAPADLIVIMRCTKCGWDTICQGGLCSDCAEMRDQSRWARALCALIHRDSPARRAEAA